MLDMGFVPLTLLATVLLAVLLISARVWIIQRVQQKRQRENRQLAERTRTLVIAYRSLAGSFTPPSERHDRQVEEALADIVLFGSLTQVKLAVECFQAMVGTQPGGAAYQSLVENLRADLRAQLGLEAIPADLAVPPSGPGRHPRNNEGFIGR